MKLKIKKGDMVQVIAGNDKGKKGSVLTIDKKKLKVRVSGVKMMTHFDRENGPQKREGEIDYSNVQFVSAAASKAKKKTAKKSAAKA